MAILRPEGLVHGHYECRSLDATLPVFTDLFACEVSGRSGTSALVRHPNTGWTLVVHEGGPGAPTKPHGNHYGFRVADHTEVEAAYRYINERKDNYSLTQVTEPAGSHFAYSIYVDEPGGNTIELEYYNVNAAAHGRKVAAGHWKTPLAKHRFPGRGYVPQALSHGTAQCDDKATSNAFYTEVLGLDIVGGGQVSTYIGHPDTPWYVVVLPSTWRTYLRPVNRYALKVATANDVRSAYAALRSMDHGVTELRDLHEQDGEAWFVLSDLDRNWWEVTSTDVPNRAVE